MSLLGKLFGRKPKFTEHVYKSYPVKVAALVKAAQDSLAEQVYPLVICHFKDHLERAAAAFDAADVPHFIWPQLDRAKLNQAEALIREGRVGVMSAAHLPPQTSAARRRPRAAPVRILLFEHYPVPPPDARILALGDYLSAPVEFHCFTSLEDPALATFGMERIRPMLEQLGLDEDEELSGSMLARSIRQAQEKLEKHVHQNDRPADSPTEWMQKNMPA